MGKRINNCQFVGPFNTPISLDDGVGTLTFTESQHGFDWEWPIKTYYDGQYVIGTGPEGWIPDGVELIPNTPLKPVKKTIGVDVTDNSIKILFESDDYHSFINPEDISTDGHIMSKICSPFYPDTKGNKFWQFNWPVDTPPGHDGSTINIYENFAPSTVRTGRDDFYDALDLLHESYSMDENDKDFFRNLRAWYNTSWNGTTEDSNFLLNLVDPFPTWEQFECSDGIHQRCKYHVDNQALSFTCLFEETCGVDDCVPFNGISLREYCEDEGVNPDSEECQVTTHEVYSKVSLGTHLMHDFIGGCPNPNHPDYNTNTCVWWSDYELSETEMDNFYVQNVCSIQDCNYTLVEFCYEDGCSLMDECNRCICGEYALNNNTANNCVELDLVDACNSDDNGYYCIDSELDECGLCFGENTADLGCGCFGEEPYWFFLDKDFDCEIDDSGVVINPGGYGDGECDVSEAKVFCKNISEKITSNTCNFIDSTGGTRNCLFKEYHPYKYVDCNLSVDLNTYVPYTSDANDWNDVTYELITNYSSCYYDIDNSHDVGNTLQEQLQGCMDVDASNYDDNATFGVSESECVYEHDVGDVILTLDYFSYFHKSQVPADFNIYVQGISHAIAVEMTNIPGTDNFKAVVGSLAPGTILKYNYLMLDDEVLNDSAPNWIDEGITREILIKNNIPTYANVDYFNNYINQLQENKTNLPILTFSKDTLELRVIKDELDELINLDGGLIDTTGYFEDMIPEDPWLIYKQDFTFTTYGENPLEVLGVEGDDWYIDTLLGDATKIKNKFGFYIANNMSNLYSYDNKFVEVVQDFNQSETSSYQTYRGINILRENITDSNFVTDDGLYYFSEDEPFFPIRADGATLSIDFDWETLPPENNIISQTIDVNNFVDWYLLTEITSNLNTITDSVVYKESGIIKILPPTQFLTSYGDTTLSPVGGTAATFYGEYYPVDTSDTSYNGFVLEDLFNTYSIGQSDRGLFSLFTLLRATDIQVFRSRWNELRGGILDIDNIIKQIDYYYDYLKNSFKADNKKWRHLDYNNFEIYKDVIDNFKRWIVGRITWLDINWLTGGSSPFPGASAVISYCNDPSATNFNVTSNFNDNSCEYYSNKTLTFQVDMSEVNHPPVERVELEIINKTMISADLLVINADTQVKSILKKWEMVNVRNDIWEISLDVTENSDSVLYPGDYIEYHFIKHIPRVYTVETGAIEQDKSRFYVINYEKSQTLSHYFNEFINTLRKTNLPIIKINTTDINDFGPVNENNENLFYCPGYIDPLSPIGQVSGWDSDDELGGGALQCDAFKDDIDYFDEVGIQRLNHPNDNGYYGYFDDKLLCEQLTQCETNCIDGTNPQDEPKVRGFMDLIYNGEDSFHTPDDEPQLSTVLGIEIRGFSSRGFPKKQYSIELQRNNTPQCDNKNGNYNLFCNGFSPEEDVRYDEDCIFTKENDYVLLGPYRDRAYVRNALSYELSADMGNPASNSKHIEFILNGVYQGIFVMFEKPKIDKTRMDVGETFGDDGEIQCEDLEPGYCDYPKQPYTYQDSEYCCSGGYIVKIESGGEQNFFIMDDGFTKVEYYDPKEPGEIEKEFIRDKVLSTQYNTPALLDTNSFSDYVVSQELAKNNEGYTRSQYWYVKDVEPDKFYMGYIWDFNHSYGAVKSETEQFSFKEFFAVGAVWSGFGNSSGISSLASTYGFLHQESNIEVLYQRWKEYRNGGILDIDNLLDRIDNISEELNNYDAISRDDVRWFYSNQQNYYQEFSYFKTWLLARISWMDSRLSVNLEAAVNASYDWRFSPEALHSYDTDYNRTFIRITLPENNKIYDVNDTKFIKFNWITSLDLANFAEGFIFDIPLSTDSKYGDNYITFNIIDEITGIIVHNFSSPDLYGNSKSSFPEYIWNVTDIDNLAGSYYIQGKYNIKTSTGTDTISQNIFSNKLNFSIQSQSRYQGCTNTFAINFDISAQIDDGSCLYQEECDEKYIISRTDVDGLRTFDVSSGYNILSYPFPFASEQIKFFDVLDASYVSYSGQGFSDYDGVTAHFEGNSYSAVFIEGRWKSTNTKGFDINNIKPGMGIILEVQHPGLITWSIPELGDE